MIKGTRKTASTTITFITIFIVVVILAYFYWFNPAKPFSRSSNNPTDVQKMMDKDLDLYYPKTPSEVVKLFAGMMKTMYSNPEDKDIKALALKVRGLYDQKFLNRNPEDTYLKNIDTELSIWKKKNRKITNYFLVDKKKGQESELGGVNYANQYVEFTIQENTKYTQTWDVLLRQNKEKQWKILGWKIVSDKER